MNLSDFRDKKVLVTGHTGFKGSWLSLWLSMLGSEVIGFSDEVNDLCFPKNESFIKGESFEEIHEKIMLTISFDGNDDRVAKGLHKFKHNGEDHAFNPDVVMNLQNLVRKLKLN